MKQFAQIFKSLILVFTCCIALNVHAQVWSNEIHYENTGVDLNERVELAGIAGTNLVGWSLYFYDGSTGMHYGVAALTGTITNICAGFGVVTIDVPGSINNQSFQNAGGGFSDGWALVSPNNIAVELWSYEGIFTATNGPASGKTSIDIGAQESGTGSANGSIQRTGATTWVENPTTNTFGACNTPQYILPALVANISTTPISCSGGANGSVLVDAVGGFGNYTYLWTNGNTTANPTGLVAGTYTVTVSDAGGSSATASATITQPTPLVAVLASVQNVACPDNMTGSATFNLTGGILQPSTYTYPPSGSALLGVGDYILTITGNFGCTAVASFSIESTDAVPPVITCPSTTSFCYVNTASAYLFPVATDNCSGSVSIIKESGVASGTVFPVGANTQVFRATDLTGNTKTCSFTITVFPSPSIEITQYVDDVNETGVGSIEIDLTSGSAPFTYNWTKNGVFFANTEDVFGLMQGNYGATVTDANGCTGDLGGMFPLFNLVATNQSFRENGIEINPNPANDYLVLSSQTVLPKSLLLFDNTGRLLLKREQFQIPLQLDISNLASGIYQILLLDEAGKGYYTRVVKR